MTEVVEELVPSRGSRAAVAGFVFAAVFTVAWLLLERSPAVRATDAELAGFYSSPSRRRWPLIVGLYFAPIAAVAFIWFAAAFRHRVVTVGGREHALFSMVYTIAATLFTTSVFLVAAIELATVWSVESDDVDVDALRSMAAIGTAMSQLVGLRSGAVFVAVATTRALRCGMFPRWFGTLSYAVAAALMLIATTWSLVVLAIPAWVAASSWLTLVERRRSDDVVAA